VSRDVINHAIIRFPISYTDFGRRILKPCPHCRRKVRLSHFSATVWTGLKSFMSAVPIYDAEAVHLSLGSCRSLDHCLESRESNV